MTSSFVVAGRPLTPGAVQVLRVGGVACLFAIAVWAGFRYPAERWIALMTLALALAGAVGLLARQFTAPIAGVQLLVLLGVLAPVRVRGNVDLCLVLAALLCGTWLLRPVFQRRSLELHAVPVVVAALAFVGIAILSFLAGQYPWFPTEPAPMRAQAGGLALFLLSGGLFLAVGHQVESVTQVRRLTWVLIAAGALAVLIQFTPWLPGVAYFRRYHSQGTIGSMFWTWLVALSLGQAVFNTQLSGLARLACASVGGMTLIRGIFFAFSWASGWLPPLVAAGVILLIRIPRLTIGGALLLVVPALLLADRATAAVMGSESYSWMTRLEAAGVMLRLIEGSPLLGYGPANYYHYTVLFPILGWWVKFNSHNNYLDLLAQTGVVGLLAFAWFSFEALRLGVRLARRSGAGFVRAFAISAVAGLIGSLVAGVLADWLIPFVYNIGLTGFRSSLLLWVFLGALFGLERVTSAEARRSASPAVEFARA